MSATGKTLADYLEALPDGSVRWQPAFLRLVLRTPALSDTPRTHESLDEALAWLSEHVDGWWPVVDAMAELEQREAKP